MAASPQLPSVQPKSIGAAYAFWCLCIFGICGGQRFYVGKTGSGILYLFTFGIFGIGQLVDLFTTGEMVGTYNMSRGFVPGAYANPLPQQQVIVNVGENIKSSLDAAGQTASSLPDQSEEHKILSALTDGQLSVAHIAVKTHIPSANVRELLNELEQAHMVKGEVSETGAILYSIL